MTRSTLRLEGTRKSALWVACASLVLAYTFLPLGTAPVVVFSALAALMSLVFIAPPLRSSNVWRNPLVVASLGMFLVYMLGLLHSNHSATELVKALNLCSFFVSLALE
jgi:hypothetical protein